MTEGLDPTHYALEDEELEGLLDGAGQEPDDNPVAAFFVDARKLEYADAPRPDGRLREVFAATSAAGAERAVTAQITAVDSADEPVLASKPPRRVPSPPTAVATKAYRPSTFAVISEALRPSPSKILMALSGLLLVVIGAQALDLINLPGISGTGVNTDVVAGIDADDLASTTTASEPSSTTTRAAPAPDRGVDEATTTATTARSEPTERVTTEATVPETSEVTEEPTTESSVPETSEGDTTLPDSSVTSTVESSTSVDTTPTTVVSTSEVTATTDLPSTETTPNEIVVITPGREVRAPQDVPVGVYSATVLDPAGCSLQITYAEGNTDSISAEAGSSVVFQLFEGSRLLLQVGCPQVYRPS